MSSPINSFYDGEIEDGYGLQSIVILVTSGRKILRVQKKISQNTSGGGRMVRRLLNDVFVSHTLNPCDGSIPSHGLRHNNTNVSSLSGNRSSGGNFTPY